jgi:16S rRNA (adenine1518-N6/adenine1519-N6)-dimethyltransferase
MDIEELKNLLRRYRLSPNVTYGQNFLIDEEVLNHIVAAAEITPLLPPLSRGEIKIDSPPFKGGVSPSALSSGSKRGGDAILEIGPGLGNLTRKLLSSGASVLAVEKDPKFLPILKSIKKDFPKTFHYEIADILKFDYIQSLGSRVEGVGNLNSKPYTQNPIDYKVVANIPYYITGKILQMLVSAKNKPKSITILLQKEVAQSITAQAGDLSILAISVQIFGVPEIVGVVPASSFYPAPKVDSAILSIKLFGKPKFSIADEKKFFSVIKACFAGKRKQIHNTLQNNLRMDKQRVAEILADLKINPLSRPQELTIEDWIKLVHQI